MAKGRRGHGEGAIYKRKVGGKVVGWTAMVDLGVENGKRKRQAFYGRERADVQTKLDDAKQALRKGSFVAGPKITTANGLSGGSATLSSTTSDRARSTATRI